MNVLPLSYGPRVTADEVRQKCASTLSNLIGPRRSFDDDNAGRVVGLSPVTVQAHRLGMSCPNLSAALNYAGMLGREFTEPLLQMVGMTGATRIVRPEVCIPTTMAETAEWAAHLARSVRDGKATLRSMTAAELEGIERHAERRAAANAALGQDVKAEKRRRGIGAVGDPKPPD